MTRNVVMLLDNADGRAMIEQICQTNGILVAGFEELVRTEVEQSGKQRRIGLGEAFDDILDRIQIEE